MLNIHQSFLVRNFFKNLFGNPSTISTAIVPAEFSGYASKAIALLANSHGQLEDDEIITLLLAHGIPHHEATELLLFLPIAFCRHLLSRVKWPDYYIEYVSEQQQSYVFYRDNPRYEIIQQALTTYLAGDFRREDYHKISGRCASFHAFNTLLLQYPGTKLEEMKVTPEHILR